MKTSFANRVARTIILAALVGSILMLADHFAVNMQPKSEGWILVAFTAAFFISEMFFWNAIESLSELTKAEAISADETRSLLFRIQTLKRQLITRWFMLLLLKAIAGGCAAFLTSQDTPGGHQRLLWLVGVGAIALSIPIALSFFQNWAQADAIKSNQIVDAKEKSQQRTVAESLAKSPSKPLKADKMLTGYTTVIRAPKSISPKK